MAAEAYNPLEKRNLGRSVAATLLACPVRQLADTGALAGAGVYVIYYTGAFTSYAPVAELNTHGAFRQPIYIGKAIPKGGRKGGFGNDNFLAGTALRNRLNQHAKSIEECANLDLADFHYQALVVDDIWIPLGENMLIEMFTPVWEPSDRWIRQQGSGQPPRHAVRIALGCSAPWPKIR